MNKKVLIIAWVIRVLMLPLIILGLKAFISVVYKVIYTYQYHGYIDFDLLSNLIFNLSTNIFIWVILITLWGADKIQNPRRKSRLLIVIIPFAILTAAILLYLGVIWLVFELGIIKLKMI